MGAEGNTRVEVCQKVIIYGALGGRMDHTLSSLHSIMKFSMVTPNQTDIILMDDHSLMLLVEPGETLLV